MIGATRSVRVWACPEPVDLRAGFDGLLSLVTAKLSKDALSGDYFLFTNRDRTSAKVLLWDGTGLCIYHKRLQRGRFARLWQREGESETVQLTQSELALFLEGCTAIGRIALSPCEYVPKTLDSPVLGSYIPGREDRGDPRLRSATPGSLAA
ncbi:MAG: IS66 family insertion sequence element accessory protein TnpB [Planctomycetes bacterium]|nr:IS66 family insertion sequence element accessory protein TnpB [Planctomycetota bacterium]